MEASTENEIRARVLCLGNDVLADDALGLLVAKELRRRLSRCVDVVDSMESGLYLMDYLLNVPHVVVVDTIQTGRSDPGTIYVLGEDDLRAARGGSPHYVGILDAVDLVRKLGLRAAQELQIVAVEASDCVNLGRPLHPQVRAAMAAVVRCVEELVG